MSGRGYLPSDLFAAFLRAQLEHRDQIQSMRRQVWQNYVRELASWAETNGARLPIIFLNENRVTACFI
jgi:dTDP-4-amino-4,6-dideoxygalactose transaminase